MADGIITPCDVARSWHWFRMVTAPCNVALELWQWIHQVAAPCSVTRDSRMTCCWICWWQHPAIWHVALGSWHWIHQVTAPCNVAGGSRMTCDWIRPNVRHIGILQLVSILTIPPQSTCHSTPVCKILSKSDHPHQKKLVPCGTDGRLLLNA